eukprot:scaffold132316_cov27-Tisochrysis_lutea.AAC.7
MERRSAATRSLLSFKWLAADRSRVARAGANPRTRAVSSATALPSVGGHTLSKATMALADCSAYLSASIRLAQRDRRRWRGPQWSKCNKAATLNVMVPPRQKASME